MHGCVGGYGRLEPVVDDFLCSVFVFFGIGRFGDEIYACVIKVGLGRQDLNPAVE